MLLTFYLRCICFYFFPNRLWVVDDLVLSDLGIFPKASVFSVGFSMPKKKKLREIFRKQRSRRKVGAIPICQ